jgi:hypothetical protein
MNKGKVKVNTPLRRRDTNRTKKTGVLKSSVINGVQLSQCAKNYLKALVDPFDNLNNACVPVSPCHPSRKITTFSKGAMYTGTAKFGFVLVRPTAGVANDSVFATHSLATYPGTVFDDTASATIQALYSNSDYAAAAFGSTANTAEYRLVGCGVRVRWRGTELDRGGVASPLATPDGDSIDGASFAFVTGYGQPTPAIRDGEWISATWKPNKLMPAAAWQNSTTAAAFCLGIGIESAVAGAAFEFEIYGHYEVIGRNIRGKTAMYSDIVGTEAVLNFVSNENGHKSFQQSLRGVDDALAHVSGLHQSRTLQALEQANESYAQVARNSLYELGDRVLGGLITRAVNYVAGDNMGRRINHTGL